MVLLVACLMTAGCGNKDEDSAVTSISPAVTEEPTAEPTATTAATPTPTPFPQMGKPDYKFVFIDHAKVYERYFSSYYFEFTEPGYFVQGVTNKSTFVNTDTGEKIGKPDKVVTGEKDMGDGSTHYYAVMIFMSKNDNLVEDNISFQAEVKYRFDSAHTQKVETDPFVINTKIEDMVFDNTQYSSYPIKLDGHYLLMDTSYSGTAYGQPDNDRTKDYAGIEYFLIKLSYEDMDYESIKKYIKIYTKDANNKLVPYVPPEGFENYIGCFQSTEDGLRYFRITIGLQFPDGLTPGEQSQIANIVARDMILVLSPEV